MPVAAIRSRESPFRTPPDSPYRGAKPLTFAPYSFHTRHTRIPRAVGREFLISDVTCQVKSTKNRSSSVL
jgi:hypothetical protein